MVEDAAPKAMTVTVVRRMRHWRRGMHILNQPVQGAVSTCMPLIRRFRYKEYLKMTE